MEIPFDRRGEFGLRPLDVRVVKTKNESPAEPASVEPVEQRRARDANVDQTSW
jgi:hypothetical protein